MKFITLSIALCGLCFGQGNPHGPTTQRISASVCSFNASNVHGNLSVSISGSACNSSDVRLMREFLELLQDGELLQLLRDDLSARKSQGTTIGWSPLTTPACTNLTVDHPSPLLYDAAALSRLTTPQAGGLIINSDIINGANSLTMALPSMNTLAGISNIITGTDHPPFPLYDAAALSHTTGLQTATSNDTTAANGLGALRFTFPTTLVGSTSQTVTGTDSLSLSKSISDLTASGRAITGWAITSTAAEPR